MHRLVFRRAFSSLQSRLNHQAHPLSGYYQLLLEKPFTPANAVPPIPPPPPPPPPPQTQTPPVTPSTTKSEPPDDDDDAAAAAAARVIFGSRLAGPGERADSKMRQAKIVAGVRVPPKPVEPDNCCMSGCVNCVWDVFRQDLEDYREAIMEVRGRMEAQEAAAAAAKSTTEGGDGGGLWEGFDIPVGIKAFMETEKRLQEKHKSTVG